MYVMTKVIITTSRGEEDRKKLCKKRGGKLKDKKKSFIIHSREIRHFRGSSWGWFLVGYLFVKKSIDLCI